MRKAVSTLISIQPGLTEACEEQRTLVANITQRLKWAAGANPILSEVYFTTVVLLLFICIIYV